MLYLLIGNIVLFSLVFLCGIRIIRPTHVGLIETLGKFSKEVNAGFHWIIPIIQSMVYVQMTEEMVDTKPQTVITKDNLNATVDAIVYYKVINAKDSEYNVAGYEEQLIALARTTLRAVIGSMSFTEANEQRSRINTEIETILTKETPSYGVSVIRVEIQKIEAPEDVQGAMNQVVIANRLKEAAIDKATAVETEADGIKRSAIKRAEGEAEAIKLVNEAADKHFKGNAVLLKQIEAVQQSLMNNTKFVLSSDMFNIVSKFLPKE